MTLIARLGSGVSAKRRRLAGVAFGNSAFGGRSGPRIEGNGSVRRCAPSTFPCWALFTLSAITPGKVSNCSAASCSVASPPCQIFFRDDFQLTGLRLSWFELPVAAPAALRRNGPSTSRRKKERDTACAASLPSAFNSYFVRTTLVVRVAPYLPRDPNLLPSAHESHSAPSFPHQSDIAPCAPLSLHLRVLHRLQELRATAQ